MVSSTEVREVNSRRVVRLQRVGALLIVIFVFLAALLFRERLVEYERYGFLGIFITMLLGSATVVLPMPGLAIVYVAGSIWNPLLVGLVASIGDAMGEATGYLAGYAGQGLVENTAIYRHFEKWMRRNGLLTIFLVSAIPNPFFDLVGVAAGASRFPAKWFFLATWVGKTIKDVTVALAGYYSLPLFTNAILPGLANLLQ